MQLSSCEGPSICDPMEEQQPCGKAVFSPSRLRKHAPDVLSPVLLVQGVCGNAPSPVKSKENKIESSGVAACGVLPVLKSVKRRIPSAEVFQSGLQNCKCQNFLKTKIQNITSLSTQKSKASSASPEQAPRSPQAPPSATPPTPASPYHSTHLITRL